MEFLPPGFPLVGELFLGNGPHERDLAAAIAGNKLPQLQSLPPGTREASRGLIWNHARLVAFDVPGLAGDDANAGARWTYAARYELLRHVVGAWSRRLTVDSPGNAIVHSALPLQLIRRYDMAHLGDFFREVVHGVPWEKRTFRGFGIPQSRSVPLSTTERALRAYESHDWLPEDGDMVALFRPNVRASGEGLMLWRQDAPWQTNSVASGHRTKAILKYKPTILTTGVVFAPPEHTHHRQDDPDRHTKPNDDDRLAGYQVRLRWWDNVRGNWTYVVPYVSSVLDPARVMALYPLDQLVFFTFVMYEMKPLYLRALGPTLSHHDAVSAQEAAAIAVRVREATPTGSQLLGGGGVPSMESLRDASTWLPGEMRALFPRQIHWSPVLFVQGARTTRRIRAGLVGITTQLSKGGMAISFGAVRDALRLAQQAGQNAANEARRERTSALQPEVTRWLASNLLDRKPECTLTYLLFVVAQWVRITKVDVDWWAQGSHTMRHLLTGWGPFLCVEPAQSEVPAVHLCYAMLRVGITIIASVWLRMGDIDIHRELRERGMVFLDALVTQVKQLVSDTLAPRWRTEAVETALFHQRQTLRAIFPKQRVADTPLHIGIVLKFIADRVSPNTKHLLGLPPKRQATADEVDADILDDDPIPHDVVVRDMAGLSHIPLLATALDEALQDNVYYSGPMRERILVKKEKWRPLVDTLIFEGDTCVPIPDVTIPADVRRMAQYGQAEGAAPDPDSAWRAIRGAVHSQLCRITT